MMCWSSVVASFEIVQQRWRKYPSSDGGCKQSYPIGQRSWNDTHVCRRLAIQSIQPILLATLIQCGTVDSVDTAADLPTCVPYRVTQTGTVSPPDAVEISGLATSRSYQGGLWVHNDSGDSARVFGLNPTGTLHTQLEMDGIDAVDFEDMAMGVNAYGEPTIVLADIGDNAKKRAQVVLYQFDEPRWETASPTQRITDISTFPLTYPDGAHDAEALLYDPVTDVFVIVTKSLSGSHISAGDPNSATRMYWKRRAL